jgi:hypothetical protein
MTNYGVLSPISRVVRPIDEVENEGNLGVREEKSACGMSAHSVIVLNLDGYIFGHEGAQAGTYCDCALTGGKPRRMRSCAVESMLQIAFSIS